MATVSFAHERALLRRISPALRELLGAVLGLAAVLRLPQWLHVIAIVAVHALLAALATRPTRRRPSRRRR